MLVDVSTARLVEHDCTGINVIAGDSREFLPQSARDVTDIHCGRPFDRAGSMPVKQNMEMMPERLIAETINYVTTYIITVIETGS